MKSQAEFLYHAPCPHCGSSDANSVYDDGHQFCFACQTYTKGDGDAPEGSPKKRMAEGLIEIGECLPIEARKLSQETCAKWGYTVSTLGGQKVQVANYKDTTGRVVAQKVRFKNKEFRFLGDTKAAGLFGQHLWRDGGKRLVITEGEIDALSVSQAQGNKWPVVSVPNGAQGARKALQGQLEWLEKFDEVVLMFDMDDPGRAAASECSLLLTPGKAKIAKLPEGFKDPSEMLQAGKLKELVDAIWEAKVYRPDGIVSGADLWQEVITEEDGKSLPFPWQRLNEETDGIFPGDVVMFTAGSGVGKSEITRELEYSLIQLGETVGIIRLEETKKRSALGLMGIHLNKPLHRKGVMKEIPEEDLKAAFDATVGNGRVFLYDHFGSTNIDNLLAKIRYLAKGCNCSVVILDHISIVVSGEEDGDERRLIDNLMTGLKALAMECKIALIVVSHLKRPGGDKGHEDGARTALAQLRGSHAIAQLSDTVIGAERDQQDEAHKNVTTLRSLKCRRTGFTGEAGWLIYKHETGRLIESLEDPRLSSDNSDNDPPWDTAEGNF